MTKTLKSLALALIPITLGVTIGCCVPVSRHSDDKPNSAPPATNDDVQKEMWRIWSLTNKNYRFSPTGIEADKQNDLVKSHIKSMQDDGSITNVINLLVTNGTFCQIRGHQWEGGCGMDGCLVIHNNPMRHCPVCGTIESREIGPWR